jgi:hypothetical protein
MLSTRMSLAAGTLTVCLLLTAVAVYQAPAMGPPDRATPQSSRDSAAGLSADQFDKLRALIKPKPGGFDDIAWMTDLWEARKKAAAEGKPLLVWVGDGHPLGWT